MPTPDITTMTSDLRALGGQRVWSLMISLFGDLAQGEGDEIDGPVLSTIMALLGVKPEAARVALHRLRNNGWIVSVKNGRTSRHSLTPKGRQETIAASPRIYALPDDALQAWQLIMLHAANPDVQENLIAAGFIQILPRVFVGPATSSAPPEALKLPGQNAPKWLQDQVAPQELVQAYQNLNTALNDLSHSLPEPSQMSALETAVLRCLIVHNWRRLVLKRPQPPRALVADPNVFHHCHVNVANLLTRFPRPSLATIAQEQAAA